MIIALVAIAGLAAVLIGNNGPETEKNLTSSVLDGVKAVIYKSPTCGCCVGFTAEANKIGMDARYVSEEDMQSVKDKYGIPREMESCHTAVIGDYFVEGHVPFEIIEKLLTEKPDIDGIAVPNMPAGTPGMPGELDGPITVYQLKDGKYSEYAIYEK